MNLDLLQSFGVLASEEGRLEEARLLLRRAVVANTGDAHAQANARDGEGKLKPQWGIDFVAPCNPTGHGWDATPQQRFERLLMETEHPIGILFNGAELRLVNAPRGESSSHITLPLEPMAEVAGRPMLGALEMLLGSTGCSAATRRNACQRYSPPAARIKTK